MTLSALGKRRDRFEVTAVIQYLSSKPKIKSAMTALVKMNRPDIFATLKLLLLQNKNAYVVIAEGLVDFAVSQSTDWAVTIYHALYEWCNDIGVSKNVYSIRKTAVLGLARHQSNGISEIIYTEFNCGDSGRQSIAIASCGIVASHLAGPTLAKQSAQLNITLQYQLVTMLMTMTEHHDDNIRKYARRKMVSTSNNELNVLLPAQAETSSVTQQVAAISYLRDRYCVAMLPKFLAFAKSKDISILSAALTPLGQCPSVNEINKFTALMGSAKFDAYNREVINSIKAILNIVLKTCNNCHFK